MAPRIIRSFFQISGLMHRGRVEERCDAELQKAIEALESHPEEKVKAVVSYSVTITKLGDRLDFQPAIETKLPKEKGFSSVTFWPAEGGGVSLEHPSQADMFSGPRPAETRFSIDVK